MWVLAVVTTLIWGVAELFYKRGAREDEPFAHLKICVWVGLAMGVHAALTMLTNEAYFRPVHLLEYLPVSCCYILSMAFSFFGMRFIEESISDPVENTSGALCSLMCVLFLGQTLSIWAGVAIGVIAIGVVGIGVLERRSGQRRKKLGKKLAIIAFAMPFAYALIDALGSFLDVWYLDVVQTPLTYVTEENIELVANTAYELTFAIAALIIFIILRIKKVRFEKKFQIDKAVAAVCETAGQLTYVYAMSGNGAVAAPIISGVCVVSLLLSRIFLKEKLKALQYVFIGLVIAGILVLAVVEGE